MASKNERFDSGPVLASLKDFQLKTVRHAFRELYEKKRSSRRFLVADEVGLGKTLVARGIVAKAIEKLQDDPEIRRIDVIYVCSNAAIAKQNVNRLNITGDQEYAVASRLTLLPLELSDLGNRKLNFVSFTPGTTFDLKYSTGMWKERWLLYYVLKMLKGLNKQGLSNLLRCDVSPQNWKNHLKSKPQYDRKLIKAFITGIKEDEELFGELRDLCRTFRGDPGSIPNDLRYRRNTMIGTLRRHLAKACVEALEPDLVILDEFQRFKSLLKADNEAGALAQELIGYQGVRTILLSATPYKLLTLYEEEEDHYEDFLGTLEFLFAGNKAKLERVKRDLEDFRLGLYQDHAKCRQARDSLQNELLKVMVRTERVPHTRDRDAMLHEPGVPTSVGLEDLKSAAALDKLVRATGSPEALEYWKSAPYLLNFMKGYALKQRLEDSLAGGEDLEAHLRDMSPYLLNREKLDNYQEVDPGNARLRALIDRTLARDEWKMLWMPPSLPYIERSFDDATAPITKSLVFSSWSVVPDVIAAVCSYTAERNRVLSQKGEVSYTGLYKAREALLEFSRSGGKPKAMSSLLLLYPSPTLASLVDPLAYAVGKGQPLSVDELLALTDEKITDLCSRLPEPEFTISDREDQQWYWASLANYDAKQNGDITTWIIGTSDCWRNVQEEDYEDKTTSGFEDHLQLFFEAAEVGIELGKRPEDLVQIWTEVALGSPAVCASRALSRVAPALKNDSMELMQASARIAEGFRSLFNSPDVRSMLDQGELPYWRQVLRFCYQSDLQSVLDEYVHGLKESMGLIDAPDEKVVDEISRLIQDVLSIRVSALDMDEITPKSKSLDSKIKVRCRYALRFAELKGESEQVVYRAGLVRDAFNSPFRPFILASTSIGQEGLDFHTYCHRIWHWNLPHNPVDLEQREGRVNRFKGHAIRKNVARHLGLSALKNGWSGGDPWVTLFEMAKEDLKKRGEYKNELTPYWIYEEPEDPFKVERLVPLPPFSNELSRYDALKRSLAVYRLALGQRRQEDLLAYIDENSANYSLDELAELQLDLSPK